MQQHFILKELRLKEKAFEMIAKATDEELSSSNYLDKIVKTVFPNIPTVEERGVTPDVKELPMSMELAKIYGWGGQFTDSTKASLVHYAAKITGDPVVFNSVVHNLVALDGKRFEVADGSLHYRELTTRIDADHQKIKERAAARFKAVNNEFNNIERVLFDYKQMVFLPEVHTEIKKEIARRNRNRSMTL